VEEQAGPHKPSRMNRFVSGRCDTASMDDYFDEEIPPGLPLTASELTRARFEEPRVLGHCRSAAMTRSIVASG